uniref:Vacuolar membrane-associated protein Iml1 N-terminal domain-containing protein n=1 Tax=Amphimedon queenslandica TaxID=400682 RepID=A0A1X7SHR4_AMPQE
IDKGVYISRKLLFAAMLLRVSGLWTKGETVKSGVHGDWLYQCGSASLQFFLFMQVSSEIWEFDPNGQLLYHDCASTYY